MSRLGSALLTVVALALVPPRVSAQPPAQAPAPAAQTPSSASSPAAPGSTNETVSADRRELTSDQKNAHYIGHVEIERPDVKIYADDVVMQGDANRMILTGNVVLAQGNNRLSAERAEFDTKSGLGTFYNAWGVASVQPPRQAPRPGVSVPTQTGQETNVYFFGDKIEKIGPKKYKITNGGFSTCVQPTPRWDLHADTVLLNVDHYTVLKQAVFTVKGVPMLYVPILYYPTKREQRATGFLLPTYGSSSINGQSLHNAFFWAINRSQDATIMHDWYSKLGEGYGSEYRYNYGDGSNGNFSGQLLNEKELAYTVNGVGQTRPPSREFRLLGSANQTLPGNLRARANVNYFSSVQTNQTVNVNYYDITTNSRTYGANVAGAWGTYSLNGTFDRSESFYSTTNSFVSGNGPRVTLTRNERPLLGSPLYFSANADYANIVRESNSADTNGNIVNNNSSVTRLGVSPQIRYPFTRWQFFTINSTVSWRDTYYTRSYAPTGDPTVRPSVPVDDPINLNILTVQSQIVGPVFNRIFDTPGNRYAERFKHTIEPSLTLQQSTSVANFDRLLEGLGGVTPGGANYTYGVTNRFFAKKKSTPGAPSQAREFVNVELQQTYYVNPKLSQYDLRYTTSTTATTQSNFSPVRLSARALPTNDVNATISAEFDSKTKDLRSITANGSYSWTNRVQSSLAWAKTTSVFPSADLVNTTTFRTQTFNAATNAHTRDNRFGGVYQLSYDIENHRMASQNMSAFYNAQCCGVAFQYSTFAGAAFVGVPGDHRFFLSFTLAGLGNFSPFNGALSGVPR